MTFHFFIMCKKLMGGKTMKKKRIFAFLLMFTLVINFFSYTGIDALAEETDGDIPFEITDENNTLVKSDHYSKVTYISNDEIMLTYDIAEGDKILKESIRF